ncbi:HAD family hydrolase [Streptacidiphilus monticola]|uniref:HAD family hydrolase n=1 Tax=Streptacidiphilus monticola TaxID=2161674 RepID=A0ABW1G958_9ACTN
MSSTDRPFDLIATDLDGTLLRSDHTVSERTRRALARAAEAGAAHIVVTGRSAAWTRPTLDAIGYRGLAVCGQGAQVYDSSRHLLLTSITLDREVARVALAKIEAMVGDVALAASRDGVDGEVLTGPGYRIVGDALDCVPVAAPEEFWARPISRLFIQHPSLGDDELADAARQATGGLVDVVVSGAGFVEILPVGLTKAAGLRLAASRLGLSARRAIAFGDMPNDVPMFRWAGHGVAMADAHPELKAVADEVTLSNDADGVAVVLERLFG